MTAKADFTEQEWKTVLLGPTSAGMIVVTAQSGGAVRETYSMAKTYAEAREQHGASELLDAIVAQKPETDHTHYHSRDELRQAGLQRIRDAVAVLERKAGPAEVDEYKKFVVALSMKVASAHKEDGNDDPVGADEREAIGEIKVALGALSTSA
jgi:non-homologous end joining protein Ku